MSANNCSTAGEFSGYISFDVICEWNNSRLVVSSLGGITNEYLLENLRKNAKTHLTLFSFEVDLQAWQLGWNLWHSFEMIQPNRFLMFLWHHANLEKYLLVQRRLENCPFHGHECHCQIHGIGSFYERMFFFLQNLIFFEIEMNRYLRKSALLCWTTGWICVYFVFDANGCFDSCMYMLMWKTNITMIKRTENASAIIKRSINFLVPIAFTMFAVIFAQPNSTKPTMTVTKWESGLFRCRIHNAASGTKTSCESQNTLSQFEHLNRYCVYEFRMDATENLLRSCNIFSRTWQRVWKSTVLLSNT